MIPDMKNLKLITILILLLAVTAGASAQSAKEYEQKKARLEREIAIIDRQLAENSSRSTSLMADLFLIRKNVANRKELVAESDRQIKRLNDQIYLTQREINRKQARIDTLSAHYSKLVVSAYKNRDARVWYMYMFRPSAVSDISGICRHSSIRMPSVSVRRRPGLKKRRSSLTP